jgi:ribonucleoside-diphosphate reductase alpha chain
MAKITQIQRRDGTIQDFSTHKLEKALEKTLLAVLKDQKKAASKAKTLTNQTTNTLEKHFSKKILPTVDNIVDIILELFKKHNLHIAAKAYVKYRTAKQHKYGFRTFHNIRDDLGLSNTALRVLSDRYLLKNDKGEVIETPSRMFKRVAKTIAAVDKNYHKTNIKKTEDTFYSMLSALEFLPSTPTLTNAGTNNYLLSCFALPVHDNLDSIFDTLKYTATIQQAGGATGINFSSLRPKQDVIHSSKGQSTGPVSFITIYDKATAIIKQGGRHRGSNMALLHHNHPDIQEFVQTKQLPNFSTALTLTKKFMDAQEEGKDINLINPRTKKVTDTINATKLFDMIIENAHKTGNPGIVFIDEINNQHPVQEININNISPCLEQPLATYESCALGSINLAKMFYRGKFNWEKLKRTIQHAVHFLDNVIDASEYPLPETEIMTKTNRKIGLGVMGFAECLILQGISYNTKKGVEFGEQLMSFITKEARKASQKIGEDKGSFPNFEKSNLKTYKHMRNATTTSIAPTGMISLIAECSSGIEPLFAISYARQTGEHQFLKANNIFIEKMKEKELYSIGLLAHIAKTGSVAKQKDIPANLKKLFVTGNEVDAKWHVLMQAGFQKFTDNSVSKVIMLDAKSTEHDVKKLFLEAYKLGCKNISVYVHGSRKQEDMIINDYVIVDKNYAGGCVNSVCDF